MKTSTFKEVDERGGPADAQFILHLLCDVYKRDVEIKIEFEQQQ